MKPFDIVVTPVGSKFAKSLQGALTGLVRNKIFRRQTPKQVGSITRQHFPVTINPLNKVQQFERFVAANVPAPRHATTIEGAKSIECKTLFARQLINSTNGRGIVEFESSDERYPPAPLYTEYIPKKAEYRFHVFGDKVIDVQEKRKKREFQDRNTRIRNVNNGYVYCRDDVAPPDGAADLAIRATRACGYLYGAVDLIYNEKRAQCYVLEVNSRPGICNSTCLSYANAIADYFNLTKR